MKHIAIIALMAACACACMADPQPLVDNYSPLSVAPEHVVGYWSFDGASYRDISGNGNDGTPYQVVPVDGASIGAISCDGTDDRVAVGTLGTFGSDAGSSWVTLSAWVLVDASDVTTKTVGGTFNDGSATGLRFSVDSIGDRYRVNKLGIYRRADGNFWSVIGTTEERVLNDGNWHHVVMQVSPNGSAAAFWQDGESVPYSITQNSASTAMADFQYPFWLGTANARGVVNEPFAGKLDEIVLYYTQISEADVQRLYNIGLAKLRSK